MLMFERGVAREDQEGAGAGGPQGAKSVSGGEWSDMWQVTKSSKVAYLLRRLSEIGAIPPRSPGPRDGSPDCLQVPCQV